MSGERGRGDCWRRRYHRWHGRSHTIRLMVGRLLVVVLKVVLGLRLDPRPFGHGFVLALLTRRWLRTGINKGRNPGHDSRETSSDKDRPDVSFHEITSLLQRNEPQVTRRALATHLGITEIYVL